MVKHRRISVNSLAEFAFETYDLDKNGKISKDEIRKMLIDACKDFDIKPFEEDTFEIICAKIDIDGNGTFEIDEIKLILKPMLEVKQEIKEVKKENRKVNSNRRALLSELKQKYKGGFIQDLAKLFQQVEKGFNDKNYLRNNDNQLNALDPSQNNSEITDSVVSQTSIKQREKQTKMKKKIEDQKLDGKKEEGRINMIEDDLDLQRQLNQCSQATLPQVGVLSRHHEKYEEVAIDYYGDITKELFVQTFEKNKPGISDEDKEKVYETSNLICLRKEDPAVAKFKDLFPQDKSDDFPENRDVFERADDGAIHYDDNTEVVSPDDSIEKKSAQKTMDYEDTNSIIKNNPEQYSELPRIKIINNANLDTYGSIVSDSDNSNSMDYNANPYKKINEELMQKLQKNLHKIDKDGSVNLKSYFSDESNIVSILDNYFNGDKKKASLSEQEMAEFPRLKSHQEELKKDLVRMISKIEIYNKMINQSYNDRLRNLQKKKYMRVNNSMEDLIDPSNYDRYSLVNPQKRCPSATKNVAPIKKKLDFNRLNEVTLKDLTSDGVKNGYSYIIFDTFNSSSYYFNDFEDAKKILRDIRDKHLSERRNAKDSGSRNHESARVPTERSLNSQKMIKNSNYEIPGSAKKKGDIYKRNQSPEKYTENRLDSNYVQNQRSNSQDMMSINLYNDEFEVGNNGQVLDIQRIKTQGSDVSNNYRIQSNSMSPYKKLNRNEAVFNDSINPNLNKKNRFASLSYNDVEAQNRYKQVSIKQMNIFYTPNQRANSGLRRTGWLPRPAIRSKLTLASPYYPKAGEKNRENFDRGTQMKRQNENILNTIP